MRSDLRSFTPRLPTGTCYHVGEAQPRRRLWRDGGGGATLLDGTPGSERLAWTEGRPELGCPPPHVVEDQLGDVWRELAALPSTLARDRVEIVRKRGRDGAQGVERRTELPLAYGPGLWARSSFAARRRHLALASP